MSTQERVKVLREAKANTWIALARDESDVAASGKDYAEAVENAERNGENDPVLIKIPQ